MSKTIKFTCETHGIVVEKNIHDAQDKQYRCPYCNQILKIIRDFDFEDFF